MSERLSHATDNPAERFTVEREVGRGAAGVVFRARDGLTGREIALKVVALAEDGHSTREHFLAEGRLLAGLSHPGIVEIVAFGTLGPEPVELGGRRFDADTPYIAMEWLEGRDLQRRQAETPLSLHDALETTRQAASALAAAHAAGIVHRDIKPSNIMILEPRPRSAAPGDVAPASVVRPAALPVEGLRCKVVDFGVAAAERHNLGDIGSMVGTVAYMSPEQARGDAVVDPRSDVYSLGATLFELIAGRPPHTGPSAIATLAKRVSTPAERLAALLVDVPEALDELVASMLHIDRHARPSMVEVERALAALCADPRLPALAAGLEQQNESVHSSASRLMTALVALHVGTGEARERELGWLRENGAQAAPLGRDAVVAFFGARRAVGGEAAVAIEVGQRMATAGARVGVATGRAHVTMARPVGEVVDHAAALARDSGEGELVADETSTELARSTFDFTPHPSGASLVGARLPEHRASGELAPFVGRDGELGTMLAAFERCCQKQTPIVVSVTGPPGIGKSRLARELRKGLETQARSDCPGPFVVQARGEAYGRARALGGAGDALCDLLRMPKTSTVEDFERTLAKLALQHDEGNLLARLLAGRPFPAEIEPRRARDILYLAMTELVLTLTRGEPVAFILEDTQWFDPESVAWFDHLASRAAGRALFLLLLVRPSFWKDGPQRFAEREHVRIELRPIARRAAMEIARAVIGCDASDPKLGQVAEQAAGSPLFAEELARVIAAGKPLAAVPTIEAAIQVSLDALDGTAHEALLRMSALGLAVWDKAVAALGVRSAATALARLGEADLVVERESSRFAGNREFWFKHALVRDVAYASLGEGLRAELHAAAASWLAEVGEDAATVAEHYDLGGQHVLAADYWEVAARRALATNALSHAVTMADRALTFAEGREVAFGRATLLDEVYSRLDERSSERSVAIEAMADNAYDEASELRTMGARARYDDARSMGTDVEERLLAVRRRAAALGLLDEEARCSATLATRYAYAGDFAKAELEAEHLLDLALSRGVQAAAVDAWQTLAVVRQTRGQLAAALEARRNAAKAARAARLKQREAMLTMNLGFALSTIGARAEARHEIEAGIRMAEEIGSSGTARLGRMLLLGYAAHFGASARSTNDPGLDAALAEPRAAADEAASGTWTVRDRVTLGVLFYRGCELLLRPEASVARARTLLKLAAEAYRATDNRDVLPAALGFWSEAERRAGDVELAEKIAAEAADLLDAGAPSLLNEAPIYLALHAARLGRGDLPGARQAIERAMPVLLRRVDGLRGTSYAREFLLGLSHNAQLIELAEGYGCAPPEILRILEG
ncbi:MAG: protein kinase [Polyangiaceae bacterium]|nr:protein kinase [Polyangiaceae bacterium]